MTGWHEQSSDHAHLEQMTTWIRWDKNQVRHCSDPESQFPSTKRSNAGMKPGKRTVDITGSSIVKLVPFRFVSCDFSRDESYVGARTMREKNWANGTLLGWIYDIRFTGNIVGQKSTSKTTGSDIVLVQSIICERRAVDVPSGCVDDLKVSGNETKAVIDRVKH